MEKPKLNEDEYVAALNARLRQHPLYVEGMQFRAFPEGASGSAVRGITWGLEGPFVVMAAVAQQVDEAYELVATPRP